MTNRIQILVFSLVFLVNLSLTVNAGKFSFTYSFSKSLFA